MDVERAADWADRFARRLVGIAGGAAVMIVTPLEIIYRGAGRIDATRAAPPTSRTLFEAGSITKVFTSILLARMALDGLVDLDAPVGEADPRFAALPDWITPRALATHSSGLPRIPKPGWRGFLLNDIDPYANFDAAALGAWVAEYGPDLPKPPAYQSAYSNLGFAILGEMLGAVDGREYAATLAALVINPLGMRDAAMGDVPGQAERLATPHHAAGSPTRPWSLSAFAGAGALRCGTADLAAFSRAVMAARDKGDALSAAIARTLDVEIAGQPDQCLGWLRGRYGHFHNGGTRGSSSELIVSIDRKLAVAALINSGQDEARMAAHNATLREMLPELFDEIA